MWELAVHAIAALWHVVGLLLLLVLITEFGIDGLRRLSRRLRYGRGVLPNSAAGAAAYAGADWTVAYFDEFYGRVKVGWRPYVEWWLRPFRGQYVTIDERGLRPTAGEDATGPDVVRILCFGGSTTMGLGVRDEHTIPALLASRLTALGQRAAITNFGQLGHNSTQEIISLHQWLKRGLKRGGPADIVVFYDGINEMLCAEQTGAADRLFNDSRRVAEFNLLLPERRTDLLAAAVAAWMPRTLRRLRQVTGLALRGPLPPPDADLSPVDFDALAGEVIDVYAGNIRLARLLARDHGFKTLFFWQPVITTKMVKSPDEQRFEADFSRNLGHRRRLYGAVIAEYRRRPELAKAADVIDLSDAFDDCADPVYVDAYHLSEAANAVIAEAMLPTLAKAAAECRGHA